MRNIVSMVIKRIRFFNMKDGLSMYQLFCNLDLNNFLLIIMKSEKNKEVKQGIQQILTRNNPHKVNLLTQEQLNMKTNYLKIQQQLHNEPKIKYNYEQKNQDYIQEDIPNRTFNKVQDTNNTQDKNIINNKNIVINKHSNTTQTQKYQQINQPIRLIDAYKNHQRIQSLKLDYDSLYDNIKLKPTFQSQFEIQHQSQTINNKNQINYPLVKQNYLPQNSSMSQIQKNINKYTQNQSINHIQQVSAEKTKFRSRQSFYKKKQSSQMVDQQLQTTFFQRKLTQQNIVRSRGNKFEVVETVKKQLKDSGQQTAQLLQQISNQNNNKQKIIPFEAQEKSDHIQKYNQGVKIQHKKNSKKNLRIELSKSFNAPQLSQRQTSKNELNITAKEIHTAVLDRNQQSEQQQQQTFSRKIEQRKNELDQESNKNNEQQSEQQKLSTQQISKDFDFGIYMQIYDCLKNIQNSLKSANLLKNLKSYLSLIASGKVDKFEYIRIPLHKKKILKNSLLYERIAIIIISFSYVSQTLADSYKYLSNLIKYTMNNHLIILKVLISQYNKIMPQQLSAQLKQLLLNSNKQFQNKGFQTMKDNNQILEQTIFRLSKYDTLFYQNLKKFIKNSNKFTIEQTFYFILEYFAFFLNICQLGPKIPFLSVAPNPYLPAIAENKKYTLVIDFLDIMCNPKRPDSFRPYSQYFIDQMSEYYEIVTFSISFPNQVNKIIQNLDRKKKINHKLYKHHAIKSNGIYLKDLSRLGRDMTKLILIDNQQQQYRINNQNSINVEQWSGRNKDTALAELCPILAMIVLKNMDVRKALSKYKQQVNKNLSSGVKYINYGMNLD